MWILVVCSTGSSNDSDYLNKEYSPSLWSKRYLNGVDVEGVHVSFVSEGEYNIRTLKIKLKKKNNLWQTLESEIIRQLFGYETIAYGDNHNEKYDIYGMGLPSGF